MRIVCLSDTHTERERVVVPDGDVLVHAGDLTYRGRPDEIGYELDWLASLPHPHKVFIAGNHDWGFQNEYSVQVRLHAARRSLIYLQDSGTDIDGVAFYGSPWQPWFHDWAFNLPRNGPELEAKWAAIPDDTEVLITHGPPHGIRDKVGSAYLRAGSPERAGCEKLRDRIKQLSFLRLHVFGHIHEAHGTAERGGVKYVNAAICNRQYYPTNPPIVVDL